MDCTVHPTQGCGTPGFDDQMHVFGLDRVVAWTGNTSDNYAIGCNELTPAPCAPSRSNSPIRVSIREGCRGPTCEGRRRKRVEPVKLLLFLAIIWAVFVGWSKLPSLLSTGPEPLQDSPYVTVYGRDRCGLTKRMLSDLNKSGTSYTYKIIDDPAVDKELRPRMKEAGLKARGFGLPVVDVNGEMMIRPRSDVVAKKYAQARSAERSRKRSTRMKTEPDARSTSHLGDPVVPCRINGHDTYTLRSQCPDYTR
jgi:hypothetical protein